MDSVVSWLVGEQSGCCARVSGSLTPHTHPTLELQPRSAEPTNPAAKRLVPDSFIIHTARGQRSYPSSMIWRIRAPQRPAQGWGGTLSGPSLWPYSGMSASLDLRKAAGLLFPVSMPRFTYHIALWGWGGFMQVLSPQ